jgi:hypothetical protein
MKVGFTVSPSAQPPAHYRRRSLGEAFTESASAASMLPGSF